MAREANLDTNPNAADAPDAHDAPPAAGDDDESNPPDQEGDYAPDNLNNLDAIIRRDMIAMYVHVLGFKEGAAIALYNNQQITNLDPLCEGSSGPGTVNACVWSVGLIARNFGILSTIMSFTRHCIGQSR